MLSKTDREYSVLFGPFRLHPTQRVLLEGDKPVRLGNRALDILIALVQRPGDLVGKHELTRAVAGTIYLHPSGGGARAELSHDYRPRYTASVTERYRRHWPTVTTKYTCSRSA